MFGSSQVTARQVLSNIIRKGYCQKGVEKLVQFPSDINDPRNQTTKSFRPSVDPSTTSILLFPGQGSQFVGMGQKLMDNKNALELYERASEIVKYDVLQLCLEGPKEELMRTDRCQVALLVTSVAGLELLRETTPEALESCVAAAGFSVGEYSALVFAGALSFEDAVELVQVRGLEMQKASDSVDSALMTVFLTHKSKLSYALKAAKEYCKVRQQIEKPVCEIANYLFSDAKVIGGNTEALAFIKTNMKEFGLKRVKFLPVSGAFHTKLMYPAAKQFKETLYKTEIRRPEVPVHSNVHCGADNNPYAIKKHLVSQIYKPVKWEQLMHSLYQRKGDMPFPNTYEVGPGTQLGTILRMVNNKAHASYQPVEV